MMLVLCKLPHRILICGENNLAVAEPSKFTKKQCGRSVGMQETRDLVAVWGFLHSFGDAIGLWPASLAEVLAAFATGSSSRLTIEMHVALLRLLQVHHALQFFLHPYTSHSSPQTGGLKLLYGWKLWLAQAACWLLPDMQLRCFCQVVRC